MKNQIFKLCTMALLITALLLIPAVAQSFNTIKASIPFSFTVGNTTFSSGNYLIRKLFEDGSRGILISSEDNEESLTRLTLPVQASTPKEDTTLIFHRYGDQYFLSEIWIGGSNTGMKIPKSQAEREFAAIYFKEQKKSETVSLVVSERQK